MPEINWMTILESQQDEFIIKLKRRMPAFTRSEYDLDEAIHLYPSLAKHHSEEETINQFCKELTENIMGITSLMNLLIIK